MDDDLKPKSFQENVLDFFDTVEPLLLHMREDVDALNGDSQSLVQSMNVLSRQTVRNSSAKYLFSCYILLLCLDIENIVLLINSYFIILRNPFIKK